MREGFLPNDCKRAASPTSERGLMKLLTFTTFWRKMVPLTCLCNQKILCAKKISVSMKEKNHIFLPLNRKSKSSKLRKISSFFSPFTQEKSVAHLHQTKKWAARKIRTIFSSGAEYSCRKTHLMPWGEALRIPHEMMRSTNIRPLSYATRC